MLKNIYIVSQSFLPNRGSFSGFIEEFSRHCSAKGYKVTIICGRIGGELFTQELPYASVRRYPLTRLPVFGWAINATFSAFRIRRLIRNERPAPDDLILANGETALGVMKRKYVMRATDQPAFAYLRNMEIAAGEISLFSRIARLTQLVPQSMMELFCQSTASGIIYSSDENRGLFLGYYGGKDVPYFIPRSGVKVSEFEKGDAVASIGGGTKLLFVSMREERVRKGFKQLEEALPDLFERFPDLRLVHAGEKATWNIPEKYRDRIISTGPVSWDRMKDYYKSTDIMVSCSLSEGFPNTILEAMASGRPVVTSDINGITDYITDGEEGLIYRRGDVDGLKDALARLIENPAKRGSMGKKAKEKIKRIDYPVYLAKLLEFLEKSVEKGGPQSVNLLKP